MLLTVIAFVIAFVVFVVGLAALLAHYLY